MNDLMDKIIRSLEFCEEYDLAAHLTAPQAKALLAEIKELRAQLDQAKPARDAAEVIDRLRVQLREAEARAKRLAKASEELLKAATMRRRWDMWSKDEFNEEYPDEEGWADGDVDENFLRGMDAVRAALSAHDAGKEER